MPFHRRSADKLPQRSKSPTAKDSADNKLEGEDYLRELTTPDHPVVDLVAVHGLNPGWSETHGESTWTKDDVLWLRDKEFLPKRFPNARVLLFGYNAKVAFDTTIAGVMDVALLLLNRLRSKRRSDPERPIIFLCHSLGGIVVKEALIRASHGTAYESIRQSTKGIAFFGTPHRGGNHADVGRILASIVAAITGNVKNNFMETLQKNSTIAQDIHELFKQQAQNYSIVSFYETKPFNKAAGLIVDKVSATLGLPDSIEIVVAIAANHSNICKFDKEDDTYELVIENIADLVHLATVPRTRLSPPPIFLQDAQTTERQLSVTSFKSDDSLLESSVPSIPLDHRFGMPTYSNSDLNSVSSGDITLQQSSEGSASSILTSPITLMPYSENPDFIGREDIFETIKTILQSKSRGQKRVALHGLGGVGKSQIAIKYTYWYRRTFPDHSVFWVHSGTAERFRQALLEIGTECRVPGFNDPSRNRLSVLRDWLQRDSSHHWLMILDNADDPDIFHKGENGSATRKYSPGLSQYIPDCEHGTILVTTRDLAAGRRLTKGNAPLRIERMLSKESIMLLKSKLGNRNQQHSPSEDEPHDGNDFERLATSLENLPLALVQAASFIQENSMSVMSYLRLIDEDSLAVRLLKHNFQESGRDLEVPNSVYATWKLSMEQIQKEHPKAAELLFLMAHYEQSKIPGSLLKHLVSHSLIDLTTAAGVLLRFSLIGSGSGNFYNMHRLVQLTVKQWLIKLGSAHEWATKALRLVSDDFPSGEPDTWTTCAALEPHAVKVIHTVTIFEQDRPHLAGLQKKLSWYYFTRGRWTGSENLARNACQTFEQAYGPKNRDTLSAKSSLAHILKEKGNFIDAEKFAKEVVEGTQSSLGSKDEQTLSAYNSLALIYQVEGKARMAEKLCRKALSGREKILPPSHPDIYRSQRRLASILELSGKYNAAETLITGALAGQKAIAGPSDRDTLDIQYRLAFIQRAQGKYAEAEETVRNALDIQTSLYGLKNIQTRKMQYSLAVSLIGQSKIEEAESLIHGLLTYTKIDHPLDPSHPYSLWLTFTLGRIREVQERYVEALTLYRTALDGAVRLYADHLDIHEYRSTYAATLLKADPVANLEESLRLQGEAHTALEKTGGADHPLTLTSLKRVSEVLAEKKDIRKALKIAKKVCERREKVLKLEHPDTIAAKVWVEQLEARQKQKSHNNVKPIADVVTKKQRIRSSLGDEKKDEARGLFGRWSRSSKSALDMLDSKDTLQSFDLDTEKDDEEGDFYDDSRYKKDEEREWQLVESLESTYAFKIRRNEASS